MTLSEFVYNSVIHMLVPVSVPATYIGYLGRDPDQETARKFTSPSLGTLPRNVKVWIHGASVGEMRIVSMIVDWLLEQDLDQDDIFVSAQTHSGLEQINHPHKRNLPADYPSLIAPLARHLNANSLFVMETEIWPNLFSYHSGKISILNGRLSRDSYPKYCRLKSLIKSSLNHCQNIYARNKQDRRRFETLSPEEISVECLGNLKWCSIMDPPGDEQLPDQPASNEGQPVFVAGSTHPEDEQLILDRLEMDDWLTYLAPRHLRRIPDIKQGLNGRNLEWCLWSDLEHSSVNSELSLVLVDQMGVLEALYQWGDVAFVGGSWDSIWGGHNILEPAQYDVPVITGPHLENFRESANFLKKFGLLHQVEEKKEFSKKLKSLLHESKNSEKKKSNLLQKEVRSIWENYRKNLGRILRL